MTTKVFTTNLDQNLIVKMILIRIKKNKKPLNVFNYLKILSQEAKELMDEKKDADDDIDKYKYLLVVIGNNLALIFLGCH